MLWGCVMCSSWIVSFSLMADAVARAERTRWLPLPLPLPLPFNFAEGRLFGFRTGIRLGRTATTRAVDREFTVRLRRGRCFTFVGIANLHSGDRKAIA